MFCGFDNVEECFEGAGGERDELEEVLLDEGLGDGGAPLTAETTAIEFGVEIEIQASTLSLGSDCLPLLMPAE